MACNSLTSISTYCGEALSGGIDLLYMIALKDLANIPLSDKWYEVDSVSNKVDSIGRIEDKAFINVGLYPNASNGTAVALTKDLAVGTNYYTHTLTFQLRGLGQEAIKFVDDATNQIVVAIVRDRQGKYFLLGTKNDLEVTAVEGGTGSVIGDGSVLNMTLVGSANRVMLEVDPTIVADLLVPFEPEP